MDKKVRFCYTVFIKKKGDFLAMKRTFLFATIASILSINAFADPATITTQDYVDTNFQTKIPAGTISSAGSVGGSIVAYTSDAGTVGERGIYNTAAETAGAYGVYLVQSQNSNYAHYKDYLPTMKTLNTGLTYISSSTGTSGVAPATSGNQKNRVLVPNDSAVGFNHLLTVNSADAMSASLDASQYIPTMAAMTEKQNKMTCTRWLDNAEHTDENCLLWSIE